MEKTARRMLEELQWNLNRIEYNSMTDTITKISGNVIENYFEYAKGFNSIYFDLDEKCIYFDFDRCGNDSDTIKISFNELKAIYKQVEEFEGVKGKYDD